ncbi:glutamyl aminopeptidase [Trichonephila clavipes]|nr:glutamyl aminopeptidase [Trichonephila clavipes]
MPLTTETKGVPIRLVVNDYDSCPLLFETCRRRYLATSKFQPTYARRAFPCFDEPSFKSTFSVALVHDEGHVALSNMPAQVTEPYSVDSRFFVTRFQKSVPMVTYLVCFIVSDFQFQGTTTSSGKQVSDRGWHVTSSSPVPLKTRRVGERCMLNLSRAQASSRWCGVVVRRGVSAQVSSSLLGHD